MTIIDGVLKPTGVIQLRGGTADALSEVNPLLERREIMCEVDTGRIKVGDGTHTWNDLPYSGGSGGSQVMPSTLSITLTATQIAQKYVELPSDCNLSSPIKLYVQGLLADPLTDYNGETDVIAGEKHLTWDSLNLEDLLCVGDNLFIEYFRL